VGIPVVNRAVEFITETPLQLKEIPTKAGFTSAAYMSTVFQTVLGRSPSSYRSQVSALA
jgi:transcriptional regulator GlxA family with amidase domain